MKKRSLIAAAAAAALAVLLSACSGSVGGPPAAAPTAVRVAVSGPLTTYDPALADGGISPWMLQPVYEQLIRLNPDGSYSGGLAESWTRPSPTEFQLSLRSGVRFSDGATFDAAAVKANLDHAIAAGGPDASTLTSISEVAVIDDATVRLTLTGPSPSLEDVLAKNSGMMISPRVLEAGTAATEMIGTGPYLLDTAQSLGEDHWTFVRNPEYWDDASRFPFDTISFKKYADANTILNAMRSGEIDIAYGSAATAKAAESAGLSVVTRETNTTGIVLTDRDGRAQPALADLRVRQALNYAVDRAGVTNVVAYGYGTPTSQWYGPQTRGYVADLVDAYPYDPEKAKKLLAEAGYADGFDLGVTIPPIHTAFIQAMQAAYAAIGVNLVINDAQSDFFADMSSGAEPTFSVTNAQSDLLTLLPVQLMPGGGQNPFGSSTPELAEMVDHARSSATAADAAPTLQEISTYLTDQAWFVPVYYGDAIAFARPGFQVALWPGQTVPWIYGFGYQN